MELPTPIGLLQEKGVIGEILRQLPRLVLDEAEKQVDPWSWLAAWVKTNPFEHFRKTFEAAASQRKAFTVLAQVARDGGSISNHDRHLKILAAEKRGDRKTVERLTKKHLASILQTPLGRRWLLDDQARERGLTAPPEMRESARREYEKFYAADVRHLGRKKADEKWKDSKTPRFKMNSNGDYVAAALTMDWLVGGRNGFPGLCFMSDGLLAQLLGYALPWPKLLDENIYGWKTIRTVRERIGLKKAKILFIGIENVADKKWAIINLRGEKTHSITLLPDKPLPPKL